jgi:SAM-dependent methyltransferase
MWHWRDRPTEREIASDPWSDARRYETGSVARDWTRWLRYDAYRRAVWESELRLILTWLGEQKMQPSRILDVGCGTGYVARRLGERFAVRTVAIDLALDAYQHERGPTYVSGSVYSLPFLSGTFDLVVSTGYECAALYLGGAPEEVARVVAARGLVVVDFVRMPNIYHPWQSVRRYAEYRRERAMVRRGARWSIAGLKHWHYGWLGIRERLEQHLGWRLVAWRNIIVFPRASGLSTSVLLRMERFAEWAGGALARVALAMFRMPE